jgi:hypothetical protein
MREIEVHHGLCQGTRAHLHAVAAVLTYQPALSNPIIFLHSLVEVYELPGRNQFNLRSDIIRQLTVNYYIPQYRVFTVVHRIRASFRSRSHTYRRNS